MTTFGVLLAALATAGAQPVHRLGDLVQVALAALAAGSCRSAARRTPGRLRRAWLALAVGCAGWAFGQLYWTVDRLVHDGPGGASLADLGFLCFSVATPIATGLFPTERERMRGRDIVDAAVLTLAIGAIAWSAVGSVVDHRRDLPSSALSLLCAFCDALVATMLLLAATRANANRTTLTMVSCALVAMGIADGSFAYRLAVGAPQHGPADLGWLLAFLLLGLAAARQPATTHAGGRPTGASTLAGVGDWSYFLVYGPLATSIVVQVVELLVTGTIHNGGIALTTIALVLAVLRHYATVRDNHLLACQLASRQADLEFRAQHDPLTGLGNRAFLVREVAAAVERHQERGQPFAVVVCDLDDFKGINDGLGHAVGDRLLVMVAERLRRSLRAGDVVARLGGDEFAVVLRPTGQARRALGAGAPVDPDDEVGAQTVGRRLQKALERTFAVEDARLRVGVAIGVATVGHAEAPVTVDDLLSRADIAMHAAKRERSSQPVLFREGLTLPAATDWLVRPQLDRALQDGALAAHYQPIVELCSRRLRGFEALARWPHGWTEQAPESFLSVAARAGWMPALTEHMLRVSCAQLVEWGSRPGWANVGVAVNVPPTQIIDPTFPDLVATVIDTYAVPPGRLVVEITEEALLSDLDAAVRSASRLREHGVLLSLDDFGVGYSCLAHLHRLPLDKIKLDRALVGRVDVDPDLRRVVSGILALCRDLGLPVVAEGIERESQAEVLHDLGCQFGQGFLFGAAMPAADLEPLFNGALLPPGPRSPLRAVRSAS